MYNIVGYRQRQREPSPTHQQPIHPSIHALSSFTATDARRFSSSTTTKSYNAHHVKKSREGKTTRKKNKSKTPRRVTKILGRD